MAYDLFLIGLGDSYGSLKYHADGSGEIIIGREPPPGSFQVPSNGVSREHGLFFRIRHHWLYRDLGSTNGSWINDKVLKAGYNYIIRNEDYLQLADVPFAVKVEGATAGIPGGIVSSKSSLLVFNKSGQFIDEFPIPEFGRALVVGGSQADLEIEGDVHDVPSLVIEHRGENICCYSVTKVLPLLVNCSPILETTPLKDLDIIEVANFVILLNDPKTRVTTNKDNMVENLHAKGIKDWDQSQGPDLLNAQTQEEPPSWDQEESFKKPKNDLFGTKNEDETSFNTSDFDATTVKGSLDVHPGMRHMQQLYSEEPSYRFSTPEDKLIIIMGVALVILLLFILAWWVLL